MANEADETPKGTDTAGRLDGLVGPEYRRAIGDVLRHVKQMQRWDLEWEWMTKAKKGEMGEFVKYAELMDWLKHQLSPPNA